MQIFTASGVSTGLIGFALGGSEMSRLGNLTSGEVEMLSTVYGDAIDYSLGCCVIWDVYARRDGKKT